VCGDVNAHHEGWESSLTDPRGEELASCIEDSPLIILNEDSPTRLPLSGSPSSPDISLATAHIALVSNWATHVKLNSDHLPITIALPSEEQPPPRKESCYTNFSKADWAEWIRATETEFRLLPLRLRWGQGRRCSIAFCRQPRALHPGGLPPGLCPGSLLRSCSSYQ
jgi:hypothetical protein